MTCVASLPVCVCGEREKKRKRERESVCRGECVQYICLTVVDTSLKQAFLS